MNKGKHFDVIKKSYVMVKKTKYLATVFYQKAEADESKRKEFE